MYEQPPKSEQKEKVSDQVLRVGRRAWTWSKEGEKAPSLSRRQFVGALGGSALAGGALVKGMETIFEKKEGQHEQSERFESSVEFYKTLYSMSYKEALFFDEEWAQVGDSVPLVPVEIAGRTINPLDEEGNIRPQWSNFHQKALAKDWPEREGISVMNIYNTVDTANRRDPEIEAKSLFDVVKFYGGKRSIADPSLSRYEYVNRHLGTTIQNEKNQKILAPILSLAQGIPMQESQYRNDLESRTGARGIMQFMPKDWASFGYTPEEALMLDKQVTAVDKKLLQVARHYVESNAKELALVQREFFAGDDEEFLDDFFKYIVLSGYHAGQGNISKVLEWFTKKYNTKEKLEKVGGEYPASMGKDVYLLMMRRCFQEKAVASIGSDSISYALRVEAMLALAQEEL
jgi:hypothetical protein